MDMKERVIKKTSALCERVICSISRPNLDDNGSL